MSERYFPVPIAGKKVRNCSDVTPPFFLAALPALGLPWLLTHSLIVLDSKPSGLPDQTETLQN